MSQSIKPYIQTTSDSSDTGAMFNLAFNPFTAITRSKIWMPESVRDWGRATFGGGPNSDDKTALLWHTGILFSTGAASVALIRALQAAADSRVLQKTNPQDKYKKLTSTTRQALVQMPEQGQTKQASSRQQIQRSQHQVLKHAAAWAPAAAIILGGIIGYNLTDDAADAAYNRSLKKRIQQTNNDINDIVIARAQLARGNTQGQQYKRTLQRSKTASDDVQKSLGDVLADDLWPAIKDTGSGLADWLKRAPGAAVDLWNSTQAALALLSAGVLTLGVVGGRAWSAKRNKARQQHNAAKKAINEYIRAKVQQQTLDTAPISPDVVARIQGNTKPLTARQQPQLPAGLSGAPVNIDI